MMPIVMTSNDSDDLVFSTAGFNQLRKDLTSCYVPKFSKLYKEYANSHFKDKTLKMKCVDYANDHLNYHPEIYCLCFSRICEGALNQDDINNLAEDLLYMRNSKNYGYPDKPVTIKDIMKFFAISNSNSQKISWRKEK